MKMTKKNKKVFGVARRILPYFVMFVVILGIMLIGSEKEQKASISSVIMNVISSQDFTVTVDQLSESYVIADAARTLDLPFASMAEENFASIAVRYQTTGVNDTGIIEKPNIVDISNLSQRGVITYMVKDGDTLESIANRYRLSTTQIRWSNNMKNATISVGQNLYLPSQPGILYTVKDGDALEGLAEKYQSDAAQIRIYNDLELSGLVVGETIVLPGGQLPEKERPEYVPPTTKPRYSYALIDTAERHDIRVISSHFYRSGLGITSIAGQCTWYAWYWRNYESGLPSNYEIDSTPGHAFSWAANMGAWGYLVNRYPAYGAVVQTRTSGTGHVGVVTGVVEGEYITMREMNYQYQPYRVIESTIYWEDALRWVYIHGR